MHFFIEAFVLKLFLSYWSVNSLQNLELTEASIKPLLAKLPLLQQEIGKVIIGQRETVEELLITLLAGGHCLLEGVPGLAKTLMVRTLSQAVALLSSGFSLHRI